MKLNVKKHLSLALVMAMVLSLFVGYLPANAENTSETETTGFCVHHSEHTAECGYTEAVEGQACTHVHDESCGYVEATEEVPCDMGCTDTDGDGVIDHVEGCAYQPAVEGQPCTHEHDESCGYVEATEGTPCTYALNGCPYCVVSWEWVDDQQMLTESEGSWGLGLPGVSQDDPLTQEALAELLPGKITATTDSGEELTLALTWDLSALPEEGAYEGDYTLTAALPDPYALTEDAAALSVTLQLGGGETYVGELTLPSGNASDAPYANHIVNGVSPNGTTIDLFDYWITGQTNSDYNDPNNINQGINSGHALLFSASDTSRTDVWNQWTKSSNPYKGIVQNSLGSDGYPVLAVSSSNESLAYLFDPDVVSEGKASYADVQGLLQVDSDGYYYYDSTENYAVYYEGSNSFALYEYPGVISGGQSGTVGQFFPFNEATADAKTVTVGTGPDAKSYQLMNTSYSNTATINHYFGLHMSTRFIQQNGGHTDSTRKQAVTYEFSGDDDVWIFIDGVLVADLGGIHDAASVSINFATGAITINGTEQDQTLGSILGLNTDTLTDNTYHTLDFFYLERGNVDSNMNLKYNLVTIPESDLIKVDQLGDPVPGAEFSLYAADDYATYGTDATPIATGTTDRDGEFVFLDDEGMPITIQTLYNEYGTVGTGEDSDLILVETVTPAGYRSVGEIGLYFYQGESDEVLLLSNSIWDKGAYAMPKVTTTTGSTISLLKDSSSATTGKIEKDVTLVGPGAEENPVMFAVVFQKQTNENGSYTWLPVSGDPINGWKVWEDSSWESILGAAQASTYLFQLASSGAYQVEISNLPGDIKTYYHICQDEDMAEYTIAYYYTEGDTLAEAAATNTWRIDAENTANLLDRVFSMDLYVTNIKNYLLVQKVDEDGVTVNGATFSLYTADGVTVADDGTVTVKDGATAYDSLTTENLTSPFELNGGGIFPSTQEVLPNGEYYLIETTAPTGYKLNDTAIHVIVDNTGVYADAGTAEDGVTVLRGVGSVLKSVVQFAVDDGVDTTLQGIKAALATDVTYENGSFSWNDANWDENDEDSKVLHLQYANTNSMLDYGLYDTTTAGTIDNLTIAITAGWSKLLIQQCYQHDENVDTTLKTELVDETTGVPLDITNLFSGTVTVRVSNDRTGNLKISKTVTGENAPTGQEFTFTVKLTDTDGKAISGTYTTVDASSTRSNIEFDEKGTATVTLNAGESLTILALPTGATYEVTETSVAGFTPSVQVSNDNSTATVNEATVTGTIQHNTTEDAAVVLAYTNDFDGNAKVTLTGTKTLLGRDLAANDSFTFTLIAGDKTTSDAITSGNVVLGSTTATVTGNGSSDTAEFSFGEITFEAEGTYKFTIKENLPNGVNADNPVSDGIWYDTHTTTATVTVTKDETTGILSAAVTYTDDDDQETDQADFTNAVASLTVSKTVTGSMGDREKEFEFQITLKDASGNALAGTYSYTGGTVSGVTGVDTPSDGTLTFTGGVAEFELKHGQSITIFGLPAGSTYEISETDAQADGYTTQVTVNGGTPATDYSTGSQTLSENTDNVAFVNSRDQVPVTGILLDHWPWLLAAGVCLAGGAALMLLSRGRRFRQSPGKRISSDRRQHD